jgi:hypothetical protein
VPDEINPLNGEDNPLSDGKFQETPVDGNGSRMAKPDKNDWYETVKVNYGFVLTVRRIFQSFQDMIQNHTKYILNFGELKCSILG